MITFRPLTQSSAHQYFKDDLERPKQKGGAADYYLATGTTPPVWEGALAPALGLTGPPTQEHLQKVLDGYHPITGESLVQRRLKGNERRQGVDIVASAPKSLSILGAMGFDDRIPGWIREADRLALQELEKYAAVRIRTKDPATGEPDLSKTPFGKMLLASLARRQHRHGGNGR